MEYNTAEIKTLTKHASVIEYNKFIIPNHKDDDGDSVFISKVTESRVW